MKKLTYYFPALLVLSGSAAFQIPGKNNGFSKRQDTSLNAEFATLKTAFPTDINVVKAGGWHNLQTLSKDPKQELVDLIVKGLRSGEKKVEFESDAEKLEALTILLYGMGKGFEADLVDGDWALVFSKQGKKSPRFQKAVGRKEKAGFTLNNFDIEAMTFSGDVKLLKKGLVHSTVKYDPLSTNYSKSADGKIVLRRIGCDITDAYFKFWKLPRLSLPLKRKGGFLEFIYMDEDIRITRGNRGGLFVHFRPAFLEKQL